MKRNRKKCTHCGKYVFHKPSDCYELKADISKHWTGWKSVKDAGVASAWQGPGTSSNIKLCVADNLVKSTANKNRNYWSLLSCLVKEQKEDDTNHLLSISLVMTRPKVKNKIAEKWKQKIANCTGILDMGCTSGAGAEKDMDCFHDTGLPSNKVFMLPDKTKIKAMKTMQLKRKL
jgi:hypothetical protein